ncbi:MAG: efflux RND transporter periplasmic adaptor subunit [Parvibaculum sp.]|uniref:efflux RND transporter periplasmic adaptor subunit n=1 Tax=Parvibaculum sp. TaxID=2024848 RepID=UPI0025DF3B38|nr:efflux RND transporter periplasmic adaptor subunit [Parvibaculum sp.]MCE9650520.1 efflux RND transporter periplasmic adaptor subunit [Parvibaculum sp.]
MKFASRAGTRRAAVIFLSVATLGLLAGCGDGEKKSETKAAVDAVSVFETPVTAKSLVEPVIGTGTIAAAKTTELGPRVNGIIDKVYVYVGARVKEGDPLFHTRDIEIKNRVAELENQVKLAEAEVRNTGRAYGRSNELHDKGFVSNGGLDNAQAARDAAKARLGIAQAQFASAKQALEDCTVRAPYDGVVTRRDVDEGKFMSVMSGMGMMSGGEGGGGGSGGGVMQIMKIDIVAAIVQVPEVDLQKIHVGSKGKVIIGSMGESFDSEVYILNDLIDVKTRGVELRLPILNPDYKIKPGLFARAEIYPEPRKVLSLERSAVQGTESQRYVFVAGNGVAKRTPITMRQIDATTVEVLSGLKAGDTALTGPNLALIVDGTPVKVETIAASAIDANTTAR